MVKARAWATRRRIVKSFMAWSEVGAIQAAAGVAVWSVGRGVEVLLVANYELSLIGVCLPILCPFTRRPPSVCPI